MKPSLACLACITSILPSVLACGGRDLDAGNEAQNEPDAAPDAPPPQQPSTCSTLNWGDSVNPASTDDCQNLFLGRWTLCFDDGGTAPNDSGFPFFLPQPDGIEFAQESGALRFYVLVRDAGGALVRSQAPNQRGSAVDPAVLGSTCKFWMAPDANAGDQTGWSLQAYRNPTALLVNGNASYVPAP
jgi:hypothetical protein